MKISRDNYEIWFLDYLEERLDPGQREEVRQFLKEHPDLADELEAFSLSLVADGTLSFPGKAGLKKSMYDESEFFETTALAATEGDLSEEELARFTDWLTSHPEQNQIVNSLERCKLQPDLQITFPGRGQLKKKRSFNTVWIGVASVAALLLLALLLTYPEKETIQPIQQMSSTSILPSPVISPTVESRVLAHPSKAKSPITSIPVKTLKAVSSDKKGNLQPTQEEAHVVPHEYLAVQVMKPKTKAIESDLPSFTDHIALRMQDMAHPASNEISLSDFLQNKLEALKAEEPKSFPTREEFTLAGLRLFSRLPGNHLTGKKGRDGRLTTISFNTQLLAFSIPVNR